MTGEGRVAALYVETGGCYFGLPDVDPWDRERDARLYTGPWPVVAHPPCQRWGSYWHGPPHAPHQHRVGEDQGCFGAALTVVRNYGGLIEHPAKTKAYTWFGLICPPAAGGWVRVDRHGGWACQVEQGWYGHASRKRTWLYAVGVDLPSLTWGRSSAQGRIDLGHHDIAKRRIAAAALKSAGHKQLSARKRAATPEPFRDLLLSMARSVYSLRSAA